VAKGVDDAYEAPQNNGDTAFSVRGRRRYTPAKTAYLSCHTAAEIKLPLDIPVARRQRDRCDVRHCGRCQGHGGPDQDVLGNNFADVARRRRASRGLARILTGGNRDARNLEDVTRRCGIERLVRQDVRGGLADERRPSRPGRSRVPDAIVALASRTVVPDVLPASRKRPTAPAEPNVFVPVKGFAVANRSKRACIRGPGHGRAIRQGQRCRRRRSREHYLIDRCRGGCTPG
jgi:hypothetical protein